MSSKVSKKVAQPVEEEQEKEVKIWRADGVVHREKRAAKMPGMINEQNILPESATRRRNDFNYGKTTKDKNRMIPRSKVRASHNVLEARLAEAEKEAKNSAKKASSKKDDSVKSVTKKVENMKLKKNQENDEASDEEMEDVAQEEEVQKPAPKKESNKPVAAEEPKQAEGRKSETQIRSRRSAGKKDAASLSSSVVENLKRLGAQAPQPISLRRKYGEREQTMPLEIQLFLDTAATLPKNSKFGFSDSNDCWEITEFDLNADEKEGQFFETSKDYILIADGDRIVACRESEACADFPVYLIDFENDSVEKMALSYWLNKLQPVEAQE